LKNNDNIDREMISEYRVTIEPGMSWNRKQNVTELHIKILDINVFNDKLSKNNI